MTNEERAQYASIVKVYLPASAELFFWHLVAVVAVPLARFIPDRFGHLIARRLDVCMEPFDEWADEQREAEQREWEAEFPAFGPFEGLEMLHDTFDGPPPHEDDVVVKSVN